MRSMFLPAALLATTSIVVSVLATPALAGLGSLTGDERGVWTADGTAVIVATVRSAPRPIDETDVALHEATLVPIATLAGTFDCAAFAVLPVKLWIGWVGTSIREAPAENVTVIAVISPYHKGGHIIISDLCLFMPGQSAVVVVDGLGDQRVKDVIERIRAVRHQGNPATRPATQPATRPAD